ncbi:MAG TPA: hypothetical protein DF911_05185 [Erysipelotrichaceae bacterium]|nr:hypothetical protein [Erysipelotrichaceae bacterium]
MDAVPEGLKSRIRVRWNGMRLEGILAVTFPKGRLHFRWLNLPVHLRKPGLALSICTMCFAHTLMRILRQSSRMRMPKNTGYKSGWKTCRKGLRGRPVMVLHENGWAPLPCGNIAPYFMAGCFRRKIWRMARFWHVPKLSAALNMRLGQCVFPYWQWKSWVIPMVWIKERVPVLYF